MKNLYKTQLNLPQVEFALLLFRIGVSALMLTHGIPKLIKLFGSGEIAFADPFGIGSVASLTLTVFAEVICAVLVIIGLGTRFAVIPLIITMTVAVAVIHATDGLARQEMGLLYLLCFILLYFTGAGRYSLDYYIMNKKRISAND